MTTILQMCLEPSAFQPMRLTIKISLSSVKTTTYQNMEKNSFIGMWKQNVDIKSTSMMEQLNSEAHTNI
jgi:hypothetical protein